MITMMLLMMVLPLLFLLVVVLMLLFYMRTLVTITHIYMSLPLKHPLTHF